MQKNIKEFLERIDYNFEKQELLIEALTHPSFSQKLPNYQRFEFMGDTILSMVIAEFLIKKYPDENEGQLSKRQAHLVSGDSIAIIANKIGIADVMILSESEKTNDGKNNKRNLENTLEALIAAIYFDSGIEEARKFILSHWEEKIEKNIEVPKDPVSHLQEIVQGKTKKLPEYKTIRSGGDEHKPIFTSTVKIEEQKYSSQGASKKQAQKNAAKQALDNINKK